MAKYVITCCGGKEVKSKKKIAEIFKTCQRIDLSLLFRRVN